MSTLQTEPIAPVAPPKNSAAPRTPLPQHASWPMVEDLATKPLPAPVVERVLTAATVYAHGRAAQSPLPASAPQPLPSPASGPISGPMIVSATPLPMFPFLDLQPMQAVTYEEEESISGRFRKFHAANPHVYANLHQLALSARRAGQQRGGMKAFFEILRYTTLVTTGESFKLNNNFTALYARLMMQQEPELRGFFEVRGRRAH